MRNKYKNIIYEYIKNNPNKEFEYIYKKNGKRFEINLKMSESAIQKNLKILFNEQKIFQYNNGKCDHIFVYKINPKNVGK